ncbi:MAG: YacP-like domain, partial [Planctomycetota bacterium]
MLHAVPLIIDTYNVLHVEGVLPAHLAGLDVDGLARLIGASRFAADAVWLVCDGSSQRARRMGRVVIEPAGAGRSADDHIADWLAAHSAPRRVTLVTSDRAVARRGRARGAACVS